jgi:hypothetical protein
VVPVAGTVDRAHDPAKIDRAKDLKLWLPLPREWDSQKAVQILSIDPPPDGTYEDPEFTRDKADRYALSSQQKANRAVQAGKMKAMIVPVQVEGSDGTKVIVDNLGKPWVVDRIALASNQEIVFEKGVEVLAKKGAFKGTGDSLFRAYLKENITLTGYGATLRMRRGRLRRARLPKGRMAARARPPELHQRAGLGLTLAESGGDHREGVNRSSANSSRPQRHLV